MQYQEKNDLCVPLGIWRSKREMEDKKRVDLQETHIICYYYCSYCSYSCIGLSAYRSGKREGFLGSLYKAAMNNQVTSILEKDADTVCSILSEEMENSAKLKVRLTADSAYGKMLLEHFDLCRKTMTVGYAKFLLPRVLEWLTANRQYKQAYELIFDFPEKRN